MTLLDSARTASSLVTKHADFLLVGIEPVSPNS